MKNIRGWFVATMTVFAFCVFTTNKAIADTYQVFPLISDNGYIFEGMDSSGNVTISHTALPSLCGTADCNIYYNFSDGVLTGTSFTPPTFVPDNGTPCTPTLPAGTFFLRGVCNNGREAFLGSLPPGPARLNVYEGPPFSFVGGDGGGVVIFMNSMGDIVWADGIVESWFQAVDLTSRATPEPNSLLLVGTGIVTVVASVRRRAIQKNRYFVVK
jgi:PEP-CTERM motif